MFTSTLIVAFVPFLTFTVSLPSSSTNLKFTSPSGTGVVSVTFVDEVVLEVVGVVVTVPGSPVTSITSGEKPVL